MAAPLSATTGSAPFDDPTQEKAFRQWYAVNAGPGIDPNPDDPRHHYDYRAAFLAGATPDPKTHHWPSEFKTEGHPRTYMNPDGTEFSPAPKPGWIDTRNMKPVTGAEATPEGHHHFTDDELRNLAKGGLTELEVASLTDDEIRRIGALGTADPLGGKPTLPQYERAKFAAESPVLRKPQRTIPGPPVDEGPKDLESFIGSIGQSLSGQRPDEAPSPDNFKTPSWEQMVLATQKPTMSAGTTGEKLRAAQDRLIGANQPAEIFSGKGSNPHEDAAVAHVATVALQEGVNSIAQFVSHPWQQAAERPLEFGFNVLQAAIELGPALKAIKGGAKIDVLSDLRVSGPEARQAFAKEFNTRVADASEALAAEEKNMSPEQYKKANAKIDEMVRNYLREYPSSSVDDATTAVVDEAIAGTSSSAAEAELDAKLSEARLRRAPIPRYEETAKAAIVNAAPGEVAAVQQTMENKLDEIASLKAMNREMGGHEGTSTQLRALEAQITEAQSVIHETRAEAGIEPSQFRTGDVVSHTASGKTYTVESVDVRPGGKTAVNVQDAAGRPQRFIADALEASDEAPHVPPGIPVPKNEAERVAFEASIPSTEVSPEELATLAQNKAVPGHEYVPPRPEAPAKGTKITTADGITYEYVGEQQGAKGKPPTRYWKADRDMAPGRGKAGSQITENLIRESGFENPSEAAITQAKLAEAGAEVAAPAANEISESTVQAHGAVKLTDVLSASPLGAVLVAGIAKDDDLDPTPKEGSPLALKHALWAVPAGIFAYGVARYFKAPEFRAALAQAVRLDKSRPADLERVFETFLSPLFPDRPANALADYTTPAAMLAGAGMGAAVGSNVGEDETSLKGGAFGAITGGMMGAVMGANLSKQFRTNLTARQLYKMYFTEAAGMSDSAFEMKQITRTALEGRIREIKDVSEALNEFDDATNGAVQAWMSGNLAIDQVPERARTFAQAARTLFDGLSMDLLKSGLVKDKILQDTIRTNMGTYVPRLMLRYELDDPRELVEGWLRSQGKGWGYVSSKNYLKAKKDLPPAVLKALGEITDNPGYLLAKRGTITAADIEQARYHRFLLSSPENALPASLVRQQRKVTKAQRATIATGGSVSAPPQVRFYKAEGGMEAAEWQGRTYWKMADNPRYGLLRGQYVEQAVASDIISTHETTSGLQRIFNAPLSAFKFFKAVFNPASQLRNMVANTIFADVEAGIAPWRMDKWGQGLLDLNRKGAWYKRARNAGTFGGEFTVAEIGDMLLPKIKGETSAMHVVANSVIDAANAGPAAFTKWHQGSEAWARMTVFRHAVESMGLDEVAAAKFARRTIPDYQDVPRWIKVVRTNPFGAPFVSFSYKAIPRTIEAATSFGDPKKMMRFWKYPFAMAALNEYSAQENGLLGKDERRDVFGTLKRMTLRTLSAGNYNPDSYDTFRKFLPNHVGGMQIALPWRDQYDRQQYLDGTYFLPWGDAGEMGRGDIAQKSGLPFLPRQLEPSNPWFQLGVAASTGKDSFTGRDIIPAGSVGMEAGMARAQFLMRAWGPSLLNPAGYSAEALGRSFSGKFDENPNVKSRGTAIGSEIFGARTRPVDPRTDYRFKYYEMKKDLDSNMSEIHRYFPKLRQKEDLSAEEAQAYLKEHPSAEAARALRRRIEIIQGFIKKYGKFNELPPTPEKLVQKIQNQYKH